MIRTATAVPVTPADFRLRAAARLPHFIFDYIDGGANDEVTLGLNVQDFSRIRIRQRVLNNVDQVETGTLLAGHACTLPMALAPVGMAGLYARRGEVQAAQAAQAAGVPFTLSTVGICPIEEIRAATRVPFWFQLYMIRDRDVVRKLMQRAWEAGCRVLLFTVDLPLAGMRHRDTRHGLMAGHPLSALRQGLQLAARPRWVWDVGLRGKPHSFGNLVDCIPDPTDLDAFKRWIDAQFDPRVTWDDIKWIRDAWKGQLFLKGIQEVPDGYLAATVGVDGIVVSNHGGRQLDSVSSSISKVADMVDAVGDRLQVLMDGGVRSGLDVFKAIALGARGVLIGRPWAWALAAGGREAVKDSLATFHKEFRVAMALAGVNRVRDINRGHLELPVS